MVAFDTEHCRIRNSTNARVDIEAGVFYTGAIRAEDTLLLAELIQRRELPLFVSNAIVQHETLFFAAGMPPQGYPVGILGIEYIRHHRREGGEISR